VLYHNSADRHDIKESGMRMSTAEMSERLARTNITDLPRFAGFDQQDLRELRTSEPVVS
jgi:hypothetical protein